MAGLGKKTFEANAVLTAAEVNGYLMDQAVMVFDDSSARSSAIGTAVSEGMVSYLKDTNLVYSYDGSGWNAVGVESVTLTNSTATAYTIASADAGNYLRFTGASAVVTVSTATAFTAGQVVQIIDAGGGLTLTSGTGVTLQGAGTAGTALTFSLGAQYEAMSVMAVDTNTYSIIGATVA